LRRLVPVILLVLAVASAGAQDKPDPLTDSPYRLHLRVAELKLADFTGMGQVEVNLGPAARKDLGDVRILDAEGREQPWYLRSQSAAGDARIVFRTVKGIRDYDLVFGLPDQQRPDYGVRFGIGRVVIDDFLPDGAYIHGLWSWVKEPVLSGVYAHTNPRTEGFAYHGTSVIRGYPLYEGTVLHQHVLLDEKDPPEQIVLRLVYEGRPNANSWETKHYINLYWGERKIKDIGGQHTQTIRMGDLPKPGEWTRLTVRIREDILSRARLAWQGGGLPDLFGIEFCTFDGRAWWDMTSIADVPARLDLVELKRKGDAAPPTFVYQRGHSFTLAPQPGTAAAPGEAKPRVLNEVRFVPVDGDAAGFAWDFGDGSTSTETSPVHVFEGMGETTVMLKRITRAGEETAEATLSLPTKTRTERAFAVELVSVPLIVRADRKALFNLRLENNLAAGMPVDVQAVLLDATDREIAREHETVTMYPGRKHPAFKAFSLDAGASGLARVRFEMHFHGRLLARREVMVRSSTAELDRLRLEGDRFVDAFGRPAVIRAELTGAPAGYRPRERKRLPRNTVIIGTLRVPGEPFEERYRHALRTADDKPVETNVDLAGVDTLPGWSFPYRQVLGMKDVPLAPVTEVVLIASAETMLLEGIPARTATEAVGVMVDEVRRRANAEVLILTPAVYSELEDLSRQYAVRLRELGIRKDVEVVDLYSRTLRLASSDPDVLKTARVVDGVLIHRLHPEVADMALDAVLDRLMHKVHVVTE
jgi:PKD repeat protein